MQRQRRPIRIAAAAWLAAAAGLSACASAPHAPAGSQAAATTQARSAISSDLAVLTFDSAWSRISHSHYDTAFAGVDWAAVRTELRPRAEAAQTLAELRVVLSEMLDRLGESHFAIIPREAADALVTTDPGSGPVSGDAGLAVRIIGDDVLVTGRIEAGDQAT